MTFTEHLENSVDCGIFSPPTTDREAFKFISQYLLGEKWITPNPISHDQVNTEQLHDILMKYSRKYRKEYRKYTKQQKLKLSKTN